jgi:hypothetical protein
MVEQFKISYEDWEKEGIKRYGEDKKEWRFKYPNCSFVQTFNNFLKQGATKEDAQGMIGFSCIGRIMQNCKGELGNKIAPCNYAGGGLFRFNPIIITENGKEQGYFDFADSLIKEEKP